MENNKLSRNSIVQFVMRIDLNVDDCHVHNLIFSDLAKHFDRVEKREVSQMAVTFTDGDSSLATKKSTDYVLVSEINNLTLTFSEAQNSIVLESAKYSDNSAYKSTLELITKSAKSQNPRTTSSRIGLRYVNMFHNPAKTKINKIFSKGAASSISGMLGASEEISRAIAVSEYNFDAYKARVQFGVPNKFYPAKITNYDLLLDIDCYDEGTLGLMDWEDSVQRLNHAAFDLFKMHMNEAYIAELK